MELSALKYHNGRIFTCCDRTGIVYELFYGKKQKLGDIMRKGIDENIEKVHLAPRYIFSSGDGDNAKGFKCEWITSKGGSLFVGSIGKEWTTAAGVFVNDDPMYVKRINKNGEIFHENWKSVYLDIRKKLGPNVLKPGYVVHEAVEYNKDLKSWFFLPRRVSEERYDEEKEASQGAHLIIRMDKNLKNPKVIKIKKSSPKTRGFSAVKFIPGHPEEMIALRTEEEFNTGVTKTYLTVVKTNGDVLLEEKLVEKEKLEGIEIWKI